MRWALLVPTEPRTGTGAGITEHRTAGLIPEQTPFPRQTQHVSAERKRGGAAPSSGRCPVSFGPTEHSPALGSARGRGRRALLLVVEAGPHGGFVIVAGVLVEVKHVPEVVQGDLAVPVHIGGLHEHLHVLLRELAVPHTRHDAPQHVRIHVPRVLWVVDLESLFDRVKVGDVVVLQQVPEGVHSEVGLTDKEAVLLVRHVGIECTEPRLQVFGSQDPSACNIKKVEGGLDLLAGDADALLLAALLGLRLGHSSKAKKN
eukprot:CAMPEP_0174357090 /NCGR_PEP_ID=MMETSP0811_2-20130205/33996_1 /TAXON_ID=73025 ORGANISM="Eutreptiella gymnastica-like, Strain CCMP1594" /NCGR_SAMPLE_ID=MMETSP0811_2 /ASSEMBLY_ACC=CAM_ASM_000667 /LENGTH=258 /DNA_ID=CAMNT_0015489609 /DNA_START=340 /DNA_END=1113 /DNA_ORIENTATION=-